MINILKTKTERQLKEIGYQHNNAVSGKDSLSFHFYNHKIILSPYFQLWNKTRRNSESLIHYRIYCISIITNTDYFLWTHQGCTWKRENDCWKRKGFMIILCNGRELRASMVTFQAKLQSINVGFLTASHALLHLKLQYLNWNIQKSPIQYNLECIKYIHVYIYICNKVVWHISSTHSVLDTKNITVNVLESQHHCHVLMCC